MIMDGFDYKVPLIYDIEKKEYIENEVLENFENSAWTLMNGQSSHVFRAETLIGISAASNDIEGAENFVKSCFGKETQMNLFNGFAVNKAALCRNGRYALHRRCCTGRGCVWRRH